MRGHVFLSVCFAFAIMAAATAQITLGDDNKKIQCTNDSDCAKYGDMAICDYEFCDCKNGSQFSPEEAKCTEEITSFRSVGRCVTTSDCRMEDSICRFGDCVCPDDHIESSDKTKCLSLAKEVGWGCEENIQCTTKLNKTTECSGFVCVCKSGTILNNQGSCVEAKGGLDAYCNNNEVCTTLNSECQQGVCACKEGFVTDSSSQRCLEVAHGFKSPCEEAIQCTEVFGSNSVCSKSKECVCAAKHHFSDMHCWEDRGLTERCDRPDECYIAADGANQKLQCTAGQCICKPEYQADLGTLRCSGAATATISGLCLALLALVVSA